MDGGTFRQLYILLVRNKLRESKYMTRKQKHYVRVLEKNKNDKHNIKFKIYFAIEQKII